MSEQTEKPIPPSDHQVLAAAKDANDVRQLVSGLTSLMNGYSVSAALVAMRAVTVYLLTEHYDEPYGTFEDYYDDAIAGIDRSLEERAKASTAAVVAKS